MKPPPWTPSRGWSGSWRCRNWIQPDTNPSASTRFPLSMCQWWTWTMTLCSCRHDKADSPGFFFFWFYFIFFFSFKTGKGRPPWLRRAQFSLAQLRREIKPLPHSPCNLQKSKSFKMTFLIFFWALCSTLSGHGAMRQKEAFSRWLPQVSQRRGPLCKADGAPFYF